MGDGEGAEAAGGAQRVLAPTHGLLLGQGSDGAAYRAGPWAEIAPHLERYFDSQRERVWVKPPPPRPKRARAAVRGSPAARGSEADGAPLVDFRSVTVRYNS